MVLSNIFLEDEHTIVLHLSIFYEYQQFFQHLVMSTHEKARYMRVVAILLALIWVDGCETITSKSRTFVVLQLVTNVALIKYT
jgi:hypothetical protein